MNESWAFSVMDRKSNEVKHFKSWFKCWRDERRKVRRSLRIVTEGLLADR